MPEKSYPQKYYNATSSGQVVSLPIPLHSIEAEQSVLGGLMLDNTAWRAVAGILSPQDFYRQDHRLIFGAIQYLADKGSPFDVVTLAEALEQRGKLEDAGGFAYLGVLARDTPSAANVKAYAMIVLERSIDRQRQAAAARQDWTEIERLNHHFIAVKAEQENRYTPITDTELLQLEFPSVRWAVPRLIPEGVAILAGSPKIGKSWLALGIAVAVATGGVALGKIQVEPGEVLYLALEDSQRRLQKRLQCLIPPQYGHTSGHLHFVTEWPRLHLGGIDRLEEWLMAYLEPGWLSSTPWRKCARIRPARRAISIRQIIWSVICWDRSPKNMGLPSCWFTIPVKPSPRTRWSWFPAR